MQLGQCRFDIGKGDLINQDTDVVWHLPRAELHVLSLLVEYQGNVVAKSLLESGHEDDSHLSSASVARAIFTLRSFLGPQYESLIETVKGQGYMLRAHRARKESSNKWPAQFIRPQQIILMSIVLVSLLLAGFWWFNQQRHTDNPVLPLSVETVTLKSEQQVDVILYSLSNTNNELLIEQAQQLVQSLQLCPVTIWSRVFLSLSHDKQVLNITLRGDHYGQSLIRNLKISDLRQPKQFVTLQWLAQLNICSTSNGRVSPSNQLQGG